MENHRYNCLWCNFVAHSEKDILKHAKNHEIIDVPKAFECEYCEYKAKTSIILKRHIAEHHRYSCYSCDFISFSEDEIKSHVQDAHRNKSLKSQSQRYCFFFNNSRCRRQECRFVHEKAPRCKNDGSCRFFERKICLYSHSKSYLESYRSKERGNPKIPSTKIPATIEISKSDTKLESGFL